MKFDMNDLRSDKYKEFQAVDDSMVETADLAADAAEALPREATGKPPRVAGHEATGPDVGGRSSPLVKGLETIELFDVRLIVGSVR